MTKARPYRIVVMSARGYDRLVCEIDFTEKKLGIIVSEEIPGRYGVSMFPGIKDPDKAFENGERHDAIAVDHEALFEALNEAIERLRQLDRE